MKTKLRVLVSSIAAMLFVLAFVFSQFTTNSSGKIHELTAAEMAAITGTGVCKEPETKPAYYKPKHGWGCNVGTNCNHPNSAPCGTDYTYYYETVVCSGATIHGGLACGLEDTSDSAHTKHDCYCKNHWFPWGQDKCQDDQTDSPGKAKRFKADIYHYCTSI